MRCPRCHRQMQYKKSRSANVFYYECYRCGYSIDKPPQEDDTEEVNEVLNILLGEDETSEN